MIGGRDDPGPCFVVLLLDCNTNIVTKIINSVPLTALDQWNINVHTVKVHSGVSSSSFSSSSSSSSTTTSSLLQSHHHQSSPNYDDDDDDNNTLVLLDKECMLRSLLPMSSSSSSPVVLLIRPDGIVTSIINVQEEDTGDESTLQYYSDSLLKSISNEI